MKTSVSIYVRSCTLVRGNLKQTTVISFAIRLYRSSTIVLVNYVANVPVVTLTKQI